MKKNKDNLYGQMLYDLTDGQIGKDLTLRLSAFSEFLHDRKDSHRLTKILKAYEVIYNLKKGIAQAQLWIKTPLATKDRQSLTKQLVEKFGGPVELNEIVNALEEVKKSGEDVYKIISGVIKAIIT